MGEIEEVDVVGSTQTLNIRRIDVNCGFNDARTFADAMMVTHLSENRSKHFTLTERSSQRQDRLIKARYSLAKFANENFSKGLICSSLVTGDDIPRRMRI